MSPPFGQFQRDDTAIRRAGGRRRTSLELRIDAGGRRALGSPLWVGLAITAFLAPTVSLWVALVVSLVTLVFLTTYGVSHGYWWLIGPNDDAEGEAAPMEADSPIAQLRHRSATGEIAEATFERGLDLLLETE